MPPYPLSLLHHNSESLSSLNPPHTIISLRLSLSLLLLLFPATCLGLRPLSPGPEAGLNTPPTPVKYTPFKPSIAVIVGVLTILFSLTFLLLMYAKHCRPGSSDSGLSSYYARQAPVSGRKNSGIDPVIIESLPVFRFSSLSGQTNGLECAVCINRFEPEEILRLLPKCKHAFHVECVDTWLDAHSTCPLCRFRVDPEDVLLVDRVVPAEFNPDEMNSNSNSNTGLDLSSGLGLPESTRRVSGRHSSAGEKGSRNSSKGGKQETMSFRRSVDESRGVGCFDPRKDGLLLTDTRRVEHRIIINQKNEKSGVHEQQERWSDVQPSDYIFYLRSEMLMSEGHRSSGVHGSYRGVKVQGSENGRNVINERSVSEITGLSRNNINEGRDRERHKGAGAISRWMAWISQSTPPLRSGA